MPIDRCHLLSPPLCMSETLASFLSPPLPLSLLHMPSVCLSRSLPPFLPPCEIEIVVLAQPNHCATMTNLPGKLRPLPSFKDMVEIVRVIRAREVPQFIGFMWCIYNAPPQECNHTSFQGIRNARILASICGQRMKSLFPEPRKSLLVMLCEHGRDRCT